MIRIPRYAFLLLVAMHNLPAYADMGRVYHPYVEQNEREIEYGLTVRDLGSDRLLLQRAGFGYTWTDRVFTEAYVLTETLTHEEQQISGYEVEVKLQLTEQGEYWADWGLLFEVATAKDNNAHEVAAGLLWEKELTGRWVAAINGFVEYEFGSDIQNEIETALRTQFRYRQSAAFEPAIEVYLDDQDWAAGPAFIGAIRLSAGKQLRWELGLLFGLDEETPESNLRFGLEFEF
jgi:hypothetical protein